MAPFRFAAECDTDPRAVLWHACRASLIDCVCDLKYHSPVHRSASNSRPDRYDMDHNPLFSDDYLLSRWATEFKDYCDNGEDEKLRDRLHKWADRDASLTETQLEAQLDSIFFAQTWGYWGTGEKGKEHGYCLNAQHGVDGAGQGGGKGAADLALGWWGREDVPSVPQVLCEFKDIHSGLDAPQMRKGNNRSPVKQCFDYLKYAFDATDDNSTVKPTWGVVTDMNEFRLYARRVGDSHYQRFVIRSTGAGAVSLLDTGAPAAFQRFLFWKLFQRDLLLTQYGKSTLQKLLEDQWVRAKELEKSFYREYQGYREAVYEAIRAANPGFHGTRGTLVKLTQRFLDRCIFILFCEDMGKALDFPTDLLRDMLMRESTSPTYSPNFQNIWELVKQLFRAMREGGPFPPDHQINRFNGGLFAELPELEALTIPNRVFCAKGQGEDPESLASRKDTLLYLAASYNFGAHGAEHQRTITLYALGRIFEQSITDLEYMEAAADDKETIATVTKRKRDGVYYTPEWVTDYIVKETVGARLADIRSELGLELGAALSAADVRDYRGFANSKRRTKMPNNAASRTIRSLDQYEQALNKVKVLDPACGSGAFLIQALQFLLRERRVIAEERARIAGSSSLFDNDASMRSILSNNLYGVDINPESVEITQLALWLNTALPGKPLSNLDTHIRCGNSLVGPDFAAFYNAKHPTTLFAALDDQTRESVNVFDWTAAFPEVFGPDVPANERGFDCVIGNPPYVKLQNFRKIKADESDYFIEARAAGGLPLYESAQTGNFDLYLPFIEKGISLLSQHGHMGYIAPSLWLKNEYGSGLRRKVKDGKNLDRWIDFKSFQVFAEATTYTALQFFSGSPNAKVRFFLAPDGDIAPVDWGTDVEAVDYSELPDEEAWNFVSSDWKGLLARLCRDNHALGDEHITSAIFQGVKTGCDDAFVVDAAFSKQNGIEGDIARPLASGPLVKRYTTIQAQESLIFPYFGSTAGLSLLNADTLSSDYPHAYRQLKGHKTALTSREGGRFDSEQWYCFSRPQNLERMRIPKLLVAGTAPELRVACDVNGDLAFLGGRVYGIEPANADDLYFLFGLLNSKLLNFIFASSARPKAGGFFDIESQFLAPLPIPAVSDETRAAVGNRAMVLQELHTARRDKMALLQRRIDCDQCVDDNRTEDWLWADVRTHAAWKAEAPDLLSTREKTAWAKDQLETRLAAHLDRIDAVLAAGTELSAEHNAGEVRFLAAGVPLATVYVDKAESPFLSAQWRQVARGTNVTEKFRAKTLVKALLSLRKTGNAALRDQAATIDAEILALDAEITQAEAEMNALVYRLYVLTEDEIKLVEAG